MSTSDKRVKLSQVTSNATGDVKIGTTRQTLYSDGAFIRQTCLREFGIGYVN